MDSTKDLFLILLKNKGNVASILLRLNEIRASSDELSGVVGLFEKATEKFVQLSSSKPKPKG
jgi:hypothetical protein